MSSTPSAQRGSRLAGGLWLCAPIAVLLLAWSMDTEQGRAVSLPVVGVLPETCSMHTRLGIDCPGCGLTRCFVHLAHGRLAHAWELNPVGILMFIYVGLQIPFALAYLNRARCSSRAWRGLKHINPWNEKLLIVLLVALLLQWVVRLAFGELS